ncbi:MAG: putative Ig domain-containing protein, partial [Acidobacteria bacterium]|nr:putative Ig domain-containing protein [Acidobacteriota bacterium]
MKRLGGLILLALLGQTAWANVVSLTPPAVTAGGPAFTLIMNSQGADMYDIVTWNGQQLPSCVQAPIAPCFNFVNASRVDVLVPASFISLPGFVQVGFVGFNFQNLIVNQRPQIATAALPPGTTGQSYTQMVVVTGGTPPLTTSVVPGTQLPPGLTLNPNGVINGTPTLAGTYPVVVQVADIFQVTTSRTLPILITQGTVVLRPAVVGAPYSVQIPGLSATGAPASCALVSGALPAGLSLNANCTITGTPTATGQATVIVQRVFNPNLQDTVPVSLQVVAALALSPTTLPNGSVGTSYSQPVTGSGGIPPYTLRLSSGSLPTGVSLQTTQTPTTTAYSLTGNPTAAGTFNFTLQLTDSAGNASSTAYTITIGGRLAITTTSLPNGTVGVGYSQTVAATGGTPPYTFDVPPGSLPGGLSLSTAGVLSGTPATAGIAPLTVNVTDSARVAARQSLPLLIQLPAGTAGVAY